LEQSKENQKSGVGEELAERLQKKEAQHKISTVSSISK